MKTKITDAEILAKSTPKGSWTRAQLAEWGVPWPPPHGWRKQIVEHGIPYDPTIPVTVPTPKRNLQAMMDASKPDIVSGKGFGVEGDLDLDPAKLLRKVVSAVISAGHASDLYEFPDVLAFFGARLPAQKTPTDKGL